METLHIHTFETKFHLRPSQTAEALRLTNVFHDVLDESLETALECVGVLPDEEICIRQIHVPISLSLSASDPELTAQWILTLANHIEEAVRRGGPSVVRYQSPIHALTDLALGVARMEFGRAWAWKQMGLVDTASGATPSLMAAQLVTALKRERNAVLPVLLAVARHGSLASLLARLPAATWSQLAMGAMAATGVAAVRWADIEQACAEPTPCNDSVERTRLVRCMESSGFVRAAQFATDGVPPSASIRQVLAVLALLDADRGLLLRSPSRVPDLVAEAVAELESSARATSTARGVPLESPAPSPGGGGVGGLKTRRGHFESVTGRRRITKTRDVIGAMRSQHVLSTCLGPPRPVPLDGSLCEIERQRSFSRAGGLLFLLGIIDETGLNREIVKSELGENRTLAWALHQLAMTLAGVEENDAAALAFAGLRPKAEPPSLGLEPTTQTELDQMLAWRQRLEDQLKARLPGRMRTLDWVCRRKAEIVADPGWVEVHLSFEEGSTEIRRAGLDLDPGFLPWLGLVIKFVYREPL